MKLLNTLNVSGYFNRLKKYYNLGKNYYTNPHYRESQQKIREEKNKLPKRTEIINHILSLFNRETNYLEIGVRNPGHNFNKILADHKYSVDPGVEFAENPVDFKLTSDDFFDKLKNNEILSSKIKFDVIFIDGLHLAEQVDRDIANAMEYIKDDGFIILHDCNPPTEWNTRYAYHYQHTPAGETWNGTTWKAFLKWRFNSNIQSCCIDSDWGIGVLSKTHQIGHSYPPNNEFYEIHELLENKKEMLNLISFVDFKSLINENKFNTVK